MTTLRPVAAAVLAVLLAAPPATAAEITREAVNAAAFDGSQPGEGESALVLKLQVLLDRAGISPGVVDGYWGENVVSALRAFERREGLEADGVPDEEAWSRLAGDGAPVLGDYTVTAEDAAGPFVEEIPDDYAEKAELERLAYTSVGEMLAERFHMDIDLFATLNGGLDPAEGQTVTVALPGEPETGEVARIEVSKATNSVHGFDAEDRPIAHYPATVGSEDLPSPTGTHEVVAIAPDPNYTYDPDVNFQQGENTEKLIVPPGPNGPVGSMWIDLSEPTYGIHGTSDPSSVGKVASHGCVRLTNWDAEELAGRVKKGVPVVFTN